MPFSRTLRYEIQPSHLRPALITGDMLTIDTRSLSVSARDQQPLSSKEGVTFLPMMIERERATRFRDATA